MVGTGLELRSCCKSKHAPVARRVQSVGLIVAKPTRVKQMRRPCAARQGADGLLRARRRYAISPPVSTVPPGGRLISRRGGRVVECTALEMRRGGNSTGGSNPSLSATFFC